MRPSTRKLMSTGILGLSLAIVPLAGQSFAQATGDPAVTGTTAGTGAGAGTTNTGAGAGTTNTGAGAGTTDRHDEGFNPGWLGLLGLLGLAGLMPRKTHTVTTHRAGDSSGR